MTISFTFNIIVLLVGIIIGCITAVLLLVEKKNKKANIFLAALVTICIGTLLHNFLLESGIYDKKPSLYFLPVIGSLGIGPLLYLYTQQLIGNKKLSKAAIALHLSPLMAQLSFFVYAFLQNSDNKYNIYINWYKPFVSPLQNIGTYVLVAIYVYSALQLITNYKKALQNFYADDHKLALRWLQKLLLAFVTYYVLSLIFVLIDFYFKIEGDIFPSDFIRCIIIFIIGFFAIKQNSLLQIQQNIQSVADVVVETDIPSANNELSSIPSSTTKKEINEALLQEIIALVEKEALYLNENLTVADIGTALGYSARTISHTINNGLQKSFSLFINEYRVQLFKSKKQSGQFEHLSIMGLAYDCGFNSKSSFNRIFKEITGEAPSKTNSI
ncbi:helix-turn-helix domain-containing protein [Ferruginibacter yonginensis]|uniref:Helix-turn-helix domain-containing protein n=1 Tax=Ferruginibacter yonginensis TaxID=1310416 RepID=A0ABV8QSD1_9BACT